jgi:hypothetical protein
MSESKRRSSKNQQRRPYQLEEEEETSPSTPEIMLQNLEPTFEEQLRNQSHSQISSSSSSSAVAAAVYEAAEQSMVYKEQLDQSKRDLERLKTAYEELRQQNIDILANLNRPRTPIGDTEYTGPQRTPPRPATPPPSLASILMSTLVPIKISDFGGFSGENEESWIQECKQMLIHELPNSVYAKEPLALLRSALKSEARAWFYSQKPEEVNTPERLFHSIRQQFGPIEDAAELEKEFRRCSQESQETIVQFEHRLRRAAQKWNPNLMEHELVGAFKTGLSHIGLRQAVGNATTLNEAYLRAQTYEAIQETKRKETKRDRAKEKAGKKKNVATPQLILAVDDNVRSTLPNQESWIPPWHITGFPLQNFGPFPNREWAEQIARLNPHLDSSILAIDQQAAFQNYLPAPSHYQRSSAPQTFQNQNSGFQSQPPSIPAPNSNQPFNQYQRNQNYRPQNQNSNVDKRALQCYNCGKRGHFSRECRPPQQRNQNRPDFRNQRFHPYNANQEPIRHNQYQRQPVTIEPLQLEPSAGPANSQQS